MGGISKLLASDQERCPVTDDVLARSMTALVVRPHPGPGIEQRTYTSSLLSRAARPSPGPFECFLELESVGPCLG